MQSRGPCWLPSFICFLPYFLTQSCSVSLELTILVKLLVGKSWDSPVPDPSPIDESQAMGMLGSQTQVLIFVWQTLSKQDTYQVAVRHFLSLHMYSVYGRPQDTRVLVNSHIETHYILFPCV